MDERRRFQIALGGIGACLLIAGFFVLSAPPLTYPVVPPPSTNIPMPVQAALVFPEGDRHEMPAETRKSAVPRALRPALENRAIPRAITVQDVRPAPPVVLEDRPLLSRATTALVLASAPAADPAPLPSAPGEMAEEPEDDGRGAVTGAFVTAGKEVGRGFRTAGRAIKSLF